MQAAHHKVKGCYFIEGGSHTDDSDDLRWVGKGIHTRNTQGDMDNSALHLHYMYLAARWLTSHRIKSFLRYRASASLCLLLLDRFSSCLHILSTKILKRLLATPEKWCQIDVHALSKDAVPVEHYKKPMNSYIKCPGGRHSKYQKAWLNRTPRDFTRPRDIVLSSPVTHRSDWHSSLGFLRSASMWSLSAAPIPRSRFPDGFVWK